MKTKTYLLLLLLLSKSISNAQTYSQDTAKINKIVQKAMYIDEAKTDSLLLLANHIKNLSKKINYVEGLLQYQRFLGWYYEFEGKHNEAANTYIQLLKESEKLDKENFKFMAINGLATVYIQTNQLEKAKITLQKGIGLKNIATSNPLRLSTFYGNLGIVYKRQEKLDSALLYYSKSMKIKLKAKDSLAVANQKINMSSLLIKLERYNEAEQLILENLDYLKNKNREGDYWMNLNNLSGLKLAQGKNKEAEALVIQGLNLAKKLDSNQKIFESYEDLAKVQELSGRYKEAIQNYRTAAEYKEKIISSETNQKISELQETFDAEERDRENKLLSSQLESEKLKQWLFGIGAFLLGLLAVVIGFALRKNRKKNAQLAYQNDLITQQKDKLTELNVEKNNLISIVSHDLKSPFNTIALWNETLQQNIGKAPLKVAEATEMIGKTAQYGQQLINNILDIEKMEINTHKIDLQPLEVSELISELIEDFKPAAKGKNIDIKTENHLPHNFKIISDYQLLRRAVENLISNALKFSHRDSQIIVGLVNESNRLRIKIKDFGIGIPEIERHLLFGKYGKTSANPTAGEVSTGLGLSIVKRICEELGGSVSFTSEENIGSEFTIELSARL